jgi:serine/threonine protein kinase
MAITLEQFAEQLTAEGLVTAEEIHAAIQSLPADGPPDDSKQLAHELFRRQKLTAFQARTALDGKAHSLVLGNYVILDKLGQGGMGLVYKARHKRMDRFVALKVLNPKDVESPEAIKRFHREVQAAGKLIHPHIATAFDADEARGTHFFVMEYVEGSDLYSYVKEHGPLPPGAALDCISQAAEGLDYAHHRGVVHRDIKPANLLLSREGTIKILDMGLARLESEAGVQAELTGTGQIMGTVDYMAPEQAVNTKNADHRADIYSLGITLWYLLTGKSAYGGDTAMEKLLAHREQPIPSLLEALASGPRELAEVTAEQLDVIFQRMVAKRPDDRYQTMGEVLAELANCRASAGGAATIALGRSESSKLSGSLSRAGAASALATPATKPASDETFASGAPSEDTDPTTNVSLSQSPVKLPQGSGDAVAPLKRSPSWLRDWRVRVAEPNCWPQSEVQARLTRVAWPCSPAAGATGAGSSTGPAVGSIGRRRGNVAAQSSVKRD